MVWGSFGALLGSPPTPDQKSSFVDINLFLGGPFFEPIIFSRILDPGLGFPLGLGFPWFGIPVGLLMGVRGYAPGLKNARK